MVRVLTEVHAYADRVVATLREAIVFGAGQRIKLEGNDLRNMGRTESIYLTTYLQNRYGLPLRGHRKGMSPWDSVGNGSGWSSNRIGGMNRRRSILGILRAALLQESRVCPSVAWRRLDKA